MARINNRFYLRYFFLKAILAPLWIGFFLYPGIWHLLTSEEIYKRYGIWKKSFVLEDDKLIPYYDVYHKIIFPLHNAAIRGRLDRISEMTPELIQAQIDQLDCFSLAPLVYAIVGRKASEIEFLLQKGANPNTPTLYGDTPFILAIKRNDESAALQLLEQGASMSSFGNDRLLAAHLAIQAQMFKLVKRAILLEQNLDYTDENGLTTLDYAIKSKSLPMVIEIAMTGIEPKFSTSPSSNEISAFLRRWQIHGNLDDAIKAEKRDVFSSPLPAELPQNVVPNTFIELRGY